MSITDIAGRLRKQDRTDVKSHCSQGEAKDQGWAWYNLSTSSCPLWGPGREKPCLFFTCTEHQERLLLNAQLSKDGPHRPDQQTASTRYVHASSPLTQDPGDSGLSLPRHFWSITLKAGSRLHSAVSQLWDWVSHVCGR